jgi:thioesterase domain-containing protein
MDSLIESLQSNKETAANIIHAAENRRGDLLAKTHLEAQSRIQGIKEQNAESLAELSLRLREENEEKERAIIRMTEEVIAVQRASGAAHFDDIVTLLSIKVIAVT